MQKPENYPENPQHLWQHFFDFTQIPRPSKQEEKICDHVISLAKKYGYEYKTDEEKNIVIYVPASKGKENSAPVIIQNHVDMVTDATPDRKINFSEDPIKTFVEGDWLKADRTTLGADNGIGCAAALALMTDESISHPPLELLFTTDEETGLNGAWAVKGGNFKSKRLINLDTEEWGSLYIGCAGGIDKQLNKKVEIVKGDDNFQEMKVTIGGLRGGHSGIDIHKPLANAIKLLVEYLVELDKNCSFELSQFRGGRAHNIIPRDAFAIIRCSREQKHVLSQLGQDLTKRWKDYLSDEDQGVFVEVSECEKSEEVLTEVEKQEALTFMSLFPHGAHNYLEHGKEPLVSVSNNMAQVIIMNGHFYAMSSVRFFDREEARSFETVFARLSKSYGFELTSNGEYPSWKPAKENELLEIVKEQYQKTFQSQPTVTAIHAGLECGILRDRIGPIDAVSFGPTIKGAHSPQERVQISTVNDFWKLLVNIIESL